MKNTILFLTLVSGLSLAACEKTTIEKAPETVIVPVPVAGPAGAASETGETGEKGETGQSGDDGIQGKPGKAGDEDIQGDPDEPIVKTIILVSSLLLKFRHLKLT